MIVIKDSYGDLGYVIKDEAVLDYVRRELKSLGLEKAANDIRVGCFYISTHGAEDVNGWSFNRKSIYVDEKIIIDPRKNINNNKKYFSLSKLEDTGNGMYAKNSALYGKIMQDGNIFNPYIHRRYLPSQYINIIRSGNVEYYTMNYTVGYKIKYAFDEGEKLGRLFKFDKETFLERRKFFNFAVINEAADAYYQIIKCYNIEHNLERKRTYIDIAGNYYNDRMARQILEGAQNVSCRMKGCNSYSDCVDILCNNTIINIKSVFNNQTPKWDNAFMASGAYYTMKHLIMFEGFLFKICDTTEESLEKLKSLISNGEPNGKILTDFCLQLIADNKRLKTI